MMPGITYLPVGVDDGIGRRARRDRGVSDDDVISVNEAVLDDDVHRAVRRLGVAVNHHRVLDDEAFDAVA